MLTRRGFLGRIAALATVAAAPVRALLPGRPPPLQFRSDAFALTMDPRPLRFDVLYGYSALNKEMQCRVISS